MKILLADDDKIERLALADILGKQGGMEIQEAEDGQQALDILCDGYRPDLCFFDIRMPHLDGVQLLQRIRRDPQFRALKVVITSSNRDRDTIVVLAKLQISGYLLKPYDVQKAAAILQPLLLTTPADPKLASRNLLAKTMLVVEDEDFTREAIETLVKKQAGWEVVVARRGDEALTRLRDGLRPDLTLIDLQMPILDGLGLIKRIREDPELRELRLAVMSSTHERETVSAVAQFRVSQYVLKPVDEGKLVGLIGTETPR